MKTQAELEKGCGIICGCYKYKDMNPKPCGSVIEGELRLCTDCQTQLTQTIEMKKKFESILDELGENFWYYSDIDGCQMKLNELYEYQEYKKQQVEKL